LLSEATVLLLQAARLAEKEQALFYRALSTIAEERSDLQDVEALNGLLADEQHHLSRISVRLVELGHETAQLNAAAPACDYRHWRSQARQRERAEIDRYQRLLEQSDLDEETRQMLRGILEVEREHEKNLGGKYTEA